MTRDKKKLKIQSTLKDAIVYQQSIQTNGSKKKKINPNNRPHWERKKRPHRLISLKPILLFFIVFYKRKKYINEKNTYNVSTLLVGQGTLSQKKKKPSNSINLIFPA